MRSIRTNVAAGTAAALCLSLGLVAPTALAGDGHIDGARFAAFSVEGSELVEVSLSGPLLKMAAATLDWEDEPEMKELSRLIGQLEQVSATVVQVDPSDERPAKEIAAAREELTAAGWESMASIREGSEVVSVMVLTSQDSIDGLTVFVHDQEGGELVFANVVGTIDLAAIAKLGKDLELPGLKELLDQELGGLASGAGGE